MTGVPAEQPEGWASSEVRIALVGDSTLDNIVWMSKKEPCIPQQIAQAADGAACFNLAADGYTSADTLNGSKRVISVAVRARFNDPVPFDPDGVFRPLDVLNRLDPPPTHILLSVGGNDIREVLGQMRDGDPLGTLQKVVMEFQQNYAQILEQCRAVTPKTVIMMQYRPSFHMDEGGYGVYDAIGELPGPGDAVAKMNMVMQTVYLPVFLLAQENHLPVLDLPRTFDIYKTELYRHQIEPSHLGGAIIARMFAHVINTHDFDGPSLLYLTGCDDQSPISCEPNTGDWQVPHDAAAVPGGVDGDFSAHEEKVRALLGMGFDEATAEQALVVSDGHLQTAVEKCLELAK